MIRKLKTKIAKDTHFSELVKGSSIAFVYRIFGIGLGYIFTLLITRGFGPEAMGVYVLAFTVMQIAVVIGTLGMDTAMLRLTGSNVEKTCAMTTIRMIYKQILSVVILTGFVIAIIVYFLAPFVSLYVFHNAKLVSAFQLTAIGVVPMVLIYLHREALRGLKRIALYALVNNIVIPFFGILFLFILYFLQNESEIAPLIAQTAAIIVSAVLAIYLWNKEFRGIDKSEKVSNTTYKDLFSISFPMMLASSMFMIMNWTDTLMLGMFVDEKEVGIYNVALKISTFTSIALMAVNAIAAPKFAEMWGNKNINGLEKIVRQSTKMIFWSAFPILTMFLLFSHQLLSFFGEAFYLGTDVLIILTIGQFVNAISGSVNYLLNMTGNEKIVQNNILIASLINILLNYFLIPKYGMEGAAIASMISVIYWNLAGVFYIKTKLNILTLYVPLLTRYVK